MSTKSAKNGKGRSIVFRGKTEEVFELRTAIRLNRSELLVINVTGGTVEVCRETDIVEAKQTKRRRKKHG